MHTRAGAVIRGMPPARDRGAPRRALRRPILAPRLLNRRPCPPGNAPEAGNNSEGRGKKEEVRR